ncbi:hypothetical protein B0A49_04709 [Cryomyces minteri]|uniref:hAT-like transposase RNase-H fold domain-containing protein n=1 Tax=Cryomyces minteri TaxID=331657 RepID=A0A4U0XQA3_9PEZI|nr:hypothetical protein B0A49_04709 [Cryomyces minteri]
MERSDFINEYCSKFMASEFKGLVLAWVVEDNKAFNSMESKALQKMLAYLNPVVEKRGLLPVHSTVRNWIQQAHSSVTGLVTQELQASYSKIHLSFDLWTSRSMYAFCGINCHFWSDSQYKTFLIALPQQRGSHTGSNIAETVATTISHFGLQEKLGYFVTDNASNNDTCINALAAEFDFNPEHRRIRCSGHIINLVARAILFGNDVDALEEDLSNQDNLLEDIQMQLWRKRGPLGKLHNVIIFICSSPQRVEHFKQLCAKHELSEKTLLMDNNTRWNSFYYAMQRAVSLQPAIQDYLDEQMFAWSSYCNRLRASQTIKKGRPSTLSDYLSHEDWHTVNEYLAILKPLELITKLLQGNGEGGSHGVIWQVIPAMEALLRHFENLRERYKDILPQSTSPRNQGGKGKRGQQLPLTPEASQLSTPQLSSVSSPERVGDSLLHQDQDHLILCTHINLGWQKLNDYYLKTDRSPVYLASMVLHPAFTWEWIRNRWRARPDWIASGERAVLKLWQEYSSIPRQDTSSIAKRQKHYDDDINHLFEPSDDEADYVTTPLASCDEYYHFARRKPGLRRQTAGIALPRLIGRHTGENLAEALYRVVDKYEASHRIDCVMMDNASNNDTMIEFHDLLIKKIPTLQRRARLRCSDYIPSLIVKAILASQPLATLWRRFGAIGKAHNFVKFVYRSPKHREKFEIYQIEAAEEEELFDWIELMLIKDGGVRWNSTYFMLKRAKVLQKAITLFQKDNDTQDQEEISYSVSEDRIIDSDWTEVNRFLTLLRPITKATNLLEGNGSGEVSSYGSLWQVFPTLKVLSELLDKAIDQTKDEPDSYFKNGAVMGKQKLDQYWDKMTTETPFYIAATVLDTGLKLACFEDKWRRFPDWHKRAKQQMETLFKEYIADRQSGDYADERVTVRPPVPPNDDLSADDILRFHLRVDEH